MSTIHRQYFAGRFLFLMLAALAPGLGAAPLAAQVIYRQEILPAFSSFDAGENSAPVLADLDGDGDLDLAIGNQAGRLLFFENIRGAGDPLFVERRAGENPFAAIEIGEDAKPALADLDADGDLDLVVGGGAGTLRFFANEGSPAAPAFVERLGAANPFAAIDVGDSSAPALADLDGDGDRDLVVGGAAAGRARCFRNTGSAGAAAFVELTGGNNPVPATFSDERVDPELVDLDRDGDFDLMTGNTNGNVRFYKNTGSPGAATFVFQDSINDPFFGFDAGELSSPAFGDLDADGDPDALIGKKIGSLHYLKLDSSQVPFFLDQDGIANPFSGASVGTYSSPVLADLDADGDLDAAVGSGLLTVYFFKNTGSAANPNFVLQPAGANPFDDVAVGHFTTPELADLDADGDLDLLLGEEDGALNYFRNVGSPSAPVFENEFKENPFFGVFVGGTTSIELADLDADGDFDAVVGRAAGSLVYFENIGSPAVAQFVERSGNADPFAAIDPGSLGIPVLGDLDGDHDLDLLLGQDLLYFENTGSRQTPVFTERTGAANLFEGVDLGSFESPELADLDGDGDLDALIGENGGRLVFFREWRATVFSDGFESGDTRFWWAAFPGH